MLHFRCVVLLGIASAVSALNYTGFEPDRWSDRQEFDGGRGPDPLHIVLHLTRAKVESDACEGINDVLAVTLTAPVFGEVAPADFTVEVCPKPVILSDDGSEGALLSPEHDGCASVSPTCARLQVEDEPAERRTILLFGPFVRFSGVFLTHSLVSVYLNSVSFLVDGNQTEVYGEYSQGQRFGQVWTQFRDEPVQGYREGPFIADTALLNLTEPLNTADPNGCAALHPSATYAVRLLFASAVHERAADGSLTPLATSTTAAALFSLSYGKWGDVMSPDSVVGVAGAAGGSAVDVCVEGATAEPQVEAVIVNCTASAPVTPAGFPCSKPIKAFLRSWEDRRDDRDPSTFAGGHTIEFCISERGSCPGDAQEVDGGEAVSSAGSARGRGTAAAGAALTVAGVLVAVAMVL